MVNVGNGWSSDHVLDTVSDYMIECSVCMYVCVCVFVCVGVWVFMHVCIFMYAYALHCVNDVGVLTGVVIVVSPIYQGQPLLQPTF